MIVTMFWHGGDSYATFDVHNPRDAEEFASLADAKAEFRDRAGGHNSYYPCVENSEAWIVKGRAREALGTEYPDFLLTIGPRGGVRCERA